MSNERWFDTHFSLNGFFKVQASSEEEAAQKAERILEELQPAIEKVLHTGVGIEVYEVVKEE